MTGIIAPTPKFQFFSATGIPLVGGTVTTYLAGTTTLQGTWQNQALTTANTNPIVLDARGECVIWLDSAVSYKFVLKNRFGVIQWTQDNINAVSDLAGAGGAALIGYNQGGTGAVTTTVQAKLRESVSVKDFGALGNSLNDDTAAIQAAINYWSTGAGTVYFPPGVYKVTSTITVAQHRIHLVGAGSWATRINFAPTANGTCFKCSKGAVVLFQGSIKGFSFYSDDPTYTKTAIEISDTSGYLIDDIVVGGGVLGRLSSYFWTGASSVGIQVKGREAGKISKLYVYADLPIRISQNPNNAISIDHFHFQDCYLVSNLTACVTIDSGVNLTHTTFDGYQPWVGGDHGMYWNDTTSAAASIALSIKNVRWEQTNGTTGNMFYLAHNTALDQLLIENAYGGLTSKGLYFRKVKEFTLNNIFYIGTQSGLDIDASCTSGQLTQVTINNPVATVSLLASRLSGDYKIGGNIWNLIAQAPAGSNVVQTWNPSATLGFSQIEPAPFTVAAGAIVTFATTALRGMFLIYANGGPVCALMAANGTTATTKVLVASDAGWFGTAVSSANYNIYYDGGSGVYKIQNNTGASGTFTVLFLGKGER